MKIIMIDRELTSIRQGFRFLLSREHRIHLRESSCMRFTVTETLILTSSDKIHQFSNTHCFDSASLMIVDDTVGV